MSSDKVFDEFSSGLSSARFGPVVPNHNPGAVDGGRRESDPNGVPANAPGAKLDAGKNLVWLMFSGFANALEEVAQVTTVGATKYTPNGWATVPNGVDRYMQAYARHMVALGKGEVWDNGPGGTGRMHKAQMLWNLLASLELELRNENRV